MRTRAWRPPKESVMQPECCFISGRGLGLVEAGFASQVASYFRRGVAHFIDRMPQAFFADAKGLDPVIDFPLLDQIDAGGVDACGFMIVAAHGITPRRRHPRLRTMVQPALTAAARTIIHSAHSRLFAEKPDRKSRGRGHKVSLPSTECTWPRRPFSQAEFIAIGLQQKSARVWRSR